MAHASAGVQVAKEWEDDASAQGIRNNDLRVCAPRAIAHEMRYGVQRGATSRSRSVLTGSRAGAYCNTKSMLPISPIKLLSGVKVLRAEILFKA